MERWNGKVAVVTGASAGIGAAICEKLVKNGLKVIGLARRSEKVEELSKKLNNQPGKLYSLKCDLCKEEDIKNAFDWIKNNIGHVNILVNNAGIYKNGTIIDGNVDDWRQVLDTNVIGLCSCTKYAVGMIRQSGCDGHVILINSVAGKVVVTGTPPHSNIYSPSKFAVSCINEVLRREIAYTKDRIKVTSICPGYVESELFEMAGNTLDKSQKDPTQPRFIKCEDVADSVAYVLSTPPNVLIYEITIMGTTY